MKMTARTNRGIPLSSINPRYLHSNSTSHTWPFSAIAELIDNAYDPDVNAKQFWIDKTLIKDQACLIFMDNGKGMDYDKMHKMLSFGFSDKKTVKGHVPVGQYGNGFKSGSMRLGKDAIVFSKKAGAMCVGLLSQTYLEKIKAEDVIVPIVEFTSTGHTDVGVAPEYEECLHDILTHSLFNTKEDLLSEFSVIDGLCNKSKSGTRIIIWNLRRTSTENLEFDFERDRYDLQILPDVNESTRETKKQQAGTIMSVPESEYSLRAYCSILYLKPRMQVILQGQKVEAQYVTKTLANVLKDSYKPMHVKKGITISFGFNTKNKEHYGLMMYHKNRLIKAYERVACQRRANSTGVGVIGVIECNYLTPTHNKQDFDSTDEYRRSLLSVGSKLEDYWKEVHHRFKDCPDVLEDIVKQPDQNWVQCEQCLKWRKLPDCVDTERLPKKWFCKMNSDPQYRSCEAEEESEDSDDEQRGYQKTYKQDEKNQKIQEEKSSEQQSPRRSWQTPSSSDLISSSDTETDSRSLDNTFADVQGTAHSSTPTRKKTALAPNQDSPPKKKARGKCFGTTPDSFLNDSDGKAAQFKEIETAQMEDGDDVINKSTVKKEQSNEFTNISTEDQQNEVQYLQAMEEIKQLQNKVDRLESEKHTLLTSYESLQNDLEVIKKEIEKVKVIMADQEVQTDFPSSHEESTVTSAEDSNSGRGRDSQEHETQDRPENGQENKNTQLCSLRLRELRQKVARLLVTFIPALDLQQVNYDCEVIDEILTQVIEEKEAASS